MERWTSISYGKGKYSVSDYGAVINNITGKVMALQVQNSGYQIVHLWSENKRKAFTIHRLVALAFVDNPENKPQVNHKDGNKLNNRADNLVWATQSENLNHAQDNGLMVNRNESARARMSAIGSKYKKENGNRLIAFAKEKSKPVLQLTMTGEFVAEWPSVKSAQRGARCYNIGKVLKGLYVQSGGFKWQLKTG